VEVEAEVAVEVKVVESMLASDARCASKYERKSDWSLAS
jgi:hypothetical protein